MAFTVQQWHARFVEQSQWTAPLRAFLLAQSSLEIAQSILEVGCGTGAITSCIESSDKKVVGIDLCYDRLKFAHSIDRSSHFSCSDGLALPFTSGQFDIVFCHYFLLWMGEQADKAVAEMKRVTRKGGVVLAIAEPDYLSRIDYPVELEKLGHLQTQSLIRQGVIPDMGRRLPELFTNAGLTDIRFGQSGFQTNVKALPASFESEWATYRQDLQNDLSESELEILESIDLSAWQNGQRVLFVPTFYALGIVSED